MYANEVNDQDRPKSYNMALLATAAQSITF